MPKTGKHGDGQKQQTGPHQRLGLQCPPSDLLFPQSRIRALLDVRHPFIMDSSCNSVQNAKTGTLGASSFSAPGRAAGAWYFANIH